METFSPTACVRFGWETFKKRPWFLIGAFLLVFIITGILNTIISRVMGNEGVGGLISFLTNMIVQIFGSVGMVSLALSAHDSIENAKLADLWRPKFVLNYLVMSVLFFIAAAIGFILLVIPGIIVVLTLYFACYLIVDRSLGPIEAMKESARITKGHRLDLLVLLVLTLLINILGIIALLVGILVTIPMTFLAIAHSYRTLERMAGTAAP